MWVICCFGFFKCTCMHLILSNMKGHNCKYLCSLSEVLQCNVCGEISWKGDGCKMTVLEEIFAPQKADFIMCYCVEHGSLFLQRANEAGASCGRSQGKNSGVSFSGEPNMVQEPSLGGKTSVKLLCGVLIPVAIYSVWLWIYSGEGHQWDWNFEMIPYYAPAPDCNNSAKMI